MNLETRSLPEKRTERKRKRILPDMLNVPNVPKRRNLSKIRWNKTKKKKKPQFLFNPEYPKLSFDVYIDKDPSHTISIKYTTVDDVESTIKKLEKLYKAGKYPHKRIWQVGMIMKVRLEVLKEKKPEEYNLAKRYFEFLSKRTKMDEDDRHKKVFK